MHEQRLTDIHLQALEGLLVWCIDACAVCSYQSNLAKDVLDTIINIQPKDSAGGSGETRESVVRRMADELLSKLPADYVHHEVSGKIWREKFVKNIFAAVVM